MKALLLLSLLQLGILVFLFDKILAIEDAQDAAGRPSYAQTQNPATDRPQVDVFAGTVYDEALDLHLRQIIREELGALQLSGSSEPVDAVSAGVDTAEYRRRYDAVSQKLDYYESLGSISELNMQVLQSEIAKLSAADRTKAFSRLMRAMNSGKLDGRL